MSNIINLKYGKWQPPQDSGPVPLVYQLVQQHMASKYHCASTKPLVTLRIADYYCCL